MSHQHRIGAPISKSTNQHIYFLLYMLEITFISIAGLHILFSYVFYEALYHRTTFRVSLVISAGELFLAWMIRHYPSASFFPGWSVFIFTIPFFQLLLFKLVYQHYLNIDSSLLPKNNPLAMPLTWRGWLWDFLATSSYFCLPILLSLLLVYHSTIIAVMKWFLRG